MRNDSFENDPKKIWQTQATESGVMTAERIRRKARELHARTRRQMLGSIATPVVVVFFYAFGVKQFSSVQQLLHPLFACALVWSFAGLYFLNRRKRAVAMGGEAGLSAGLAFCRQELEWRRDYIRGGLLWAFGPIVVSMGTFILAMAMVAGRAIFLHAIPFLTLAVAWIAAYLVMRMRQQRELEREIEELDEIESENGR